MQRLNVFVSLNFLFNLFYLILKAFLFGISISALVGPLLFTMVHSGMKFGYKKAIWLALGTWLSDITLLIITFLLISKISLPNSIDELDLKYIWISGTALFLLGIAIIIKKSDLEKSHEYRLDSQKPAYLMVKGFFINTLNPAAFFIWLGLATFIRKTSSDLTGVIVFYSVIIFIIAAMDILKLVAGQVLSTKLNDKTIEKFKWVSGSAFIITAALLILRYGQIF